MWVVEVVVVSSDGLCDTIRWSGFRGTAAAPNLKLENPDPTALVSRKPKSLN